MSEKSPFLSRRKSSIFCKHNMDNGNIEKTKTVNIEKNKEEILNHIYKMEQEIANWKLAHRKIRYKFQELEKFKDDVNIIDWKSDLSEDDITFLNLRPNYMETVHKLENIATKSEIMKHKIFRTEIKLNETIQKISKSMYETKIHISNYLFNCEENDFSEFNDSGIELESLLDDDYFF